MSAPNSASTQDPYPVDTDIYPCSVPFRFALAPKSFPWMSFWPRPADDQLVKEILLFFNEKSPNGDLADLLVVELIWQTRFLDAQIASIRHAIHIGWLPESELVPSFKRAIEISYACCQGAVDVFHSQRAAN
ncbi:hypothetical protein HMN09_01106000 [Mycena chlorophos]|uniref:Uncharacterized protein n=1 Tax=Mycena chlorophos TaxID=658473 RepID=A0A8H6SBI6_MYCCL|nr:hypothetical protein HMN09_01106000 [Mycena chlorophos]